jgi:hypothetical protein
LPGGRQKSRTSESCSRGLLRGYTEQSLVITRLRGMGKTVLLGEYRRIAEEETWVAIEAEVSKNTDFGPQMASSRGPRRRVRGDRACRTGTQY